MKKTGFLLFIVISLSLEAETTQTEKDWALAKKRTLQPARPARPPSTDMKNFFFCGYMGTPLVHKVKMSDYFDRVFVYQKSGGSHTAHFLFKKPFKVQKKDNMIFWFALNEDLSEKTKGFQRKVFELYHFHIQRLALTRSLVYYLHKEDYKRNFQHRVRREMTEPLDLIEKPVSKNQVKKAYGRGWWRCRKVSYFKYILYSIREVFFQIGGV